MRSFLSVFCLISAVPLSGQQPLSQGDRDYALSALHGTRKQFLDTVAGLSAKQWNFKPGPDRWSVAEVAEHIALAEAGIPAGVIPKAIASPLDAEKKAKLSTRQRDEQIVKGVPDRTNKFQAPETLRPTGKFKNPQAAVEAFRTARDKNLAYVRETQDELRGHFVPHPALGDLDGLQWYLFIAAHSERHINQMREVMADPAFPKP